MLGHQSIDGEPLTARTDRPSSVEGLAFSPRNTWGSRASSCSPAQGVAPVESREFGAGNATNQRTCHHSVISDSAKPRCRPNVDMTPLSTATRSVGCLPLASTAHPSSPTSRTTNDVASALEWGQSASHDGSPSRTAMWLRDHHLVLDQHLCLQANFSMLSSAHSIFTFASGASQ